MQNSLNAAKNYNKPLWNKSVSKKIARGLKCSVHSDSEPDTTITRKVDDRQRHSG